MTSTSDRWEKIGIISRYWTIYNRGNYLRGYYPSMAIKSCILYLALRRRNLITLLATLLQFLIPKMYYILNRVSANRDERYYDLGVTAMLLFWNSSSFACKLLATKCSRGLAKICLFHRTRYRFPNIP